jgi:hypothetical protein
MIETRRIRLAGHVARMEEKRNAYIIHTNGKARRRETARKT